LKKILYVASSSKREEQMAGQDQGDDGNFFPMEIRDTDFNLPNLQAVQLAVVLSQEYLPRTG
jgi:hypothetical protein